MPDRRCHPAGRGGQIRMSRRPNRIFEPHRFASAILPPWCRKSPKINEVLPLLYLHGLSSQDFVPALESFLGTGSGLSAATVTRLATQWQDEAKAFNDRDLSTVDFLYLSADGVHLNVRLDEEKLCLLVMVGVRVDGTKHSSRWRRATGSRPGRGPTCCATASVVACAPRSSRSGTARWASGPRCAKSSPIPGSSAAGSTRSATCWRRCPSQRTPPRRPRPCRRPLRTRQTRRTPHPAHRPHHSGSSLINQLHPTGLDNCSVYSSRGRSVRSGLAGPSSSGRVPGRK
jgi:hypothetical protein